MPLTGGFPDVLRRMHLISSHHVTVCFFFMSSGETAWAWYVTQSYFLESNKSHTADCVCVQRSRLNLSVQSSFAMCPLSAVHLLPNHACSVSFSHCLSLPSSLMKNIFYTWASGIKTYSKGGLIHLRLHLVAEKQILYQLVLDRRCSKSLSLSDQLKRTHLFMIETNKVGSLIHLLHLNFPIFFASIQSGSLLLDDFETAQLFMNHNR